MIQANSKFFLLVLVWITFAFSACKKDPTPQTVAPRPPVAIAGDDKIAPAPIDSFLLDGSKSYDPDGTILSYSWKIISGPGTTYILKPERAVTYLVNVISGIYQVELTVTNKSGTGLSAKDTFQLITNNNPVANAGRDTVIFYPANTALVNGGKSFDPDGSRLAFSWKILNNPTPAYTYVKNPQDSISQINDLFPGKKYSIELTVTKKSGTGLSAKDTVQVSVIRAPVANAGSDQIIDYQGNSATLDGSRSVDPDGSLLIYSWKIIFGPGNAVLANSQSAITNITNLVPGKFGIELSVTNYGGTGITAKDTTQVFIKSNTAPVARAGEDIKKLVNSVSVIQLSGNGSSDYEKNIVSYKWEKVKGPASFNIASPNAAETVVSQLSAGIYEFELTVTDAEGLSSKDQVQVTTINPNATGNIIIFPEDVCEHFNYDYNFADSWMPWCAIPNLSSYLPVNAGVKKVSLKESATGNWFEIAAVPKIGVRYNYNTSGNTLYINVFYDYSGPGNFTEIKVEF